MEKVSFIPKKDNAKECSNYCTIAFISHVSKVMLKIPQVRLQELSDIQARFRKGRGTRDQIANICWTIEKASEFQTNIYFCFTDQPKSLTVWITTNCGKFLKEMGIPDHLTCLLRNLYVDQEATVRTRQITIDWFKMGKEYGKAVYCHPAYLTYMQSTPYDYKEIQPVHSKGDQSWMFFRRNDVKAETLVLWLPYVKS